MLVERFERRLAARGLRAVVARAAERGRDHGGHPLLVVDDQDRRLHASFRAGDAEGSRKKKRAPPPASDATAILPSCASTIRRAIARPRPTPLARVVKNGSNTRSRRSAGTPGPRSVTAIST